MSKWLYKFRILRRLKVLEWQNEMLLQKLAATQHDPDAPKKIKELLKALPRELRNK